VNSSGTGTLATNSSGTTTNAAAGTVTYAAAAILMSMRSIVSYGTTGGSVIQTWQIVSDGTVPPATAAIVEVSSTLEREFGQAETFTVFATGTGCGAINLTGTVSTGSYDGTNTYSSGGNVGSNGNLTINGSVDVHGSLSTPRTGIGTCTTGQSVTALTQSGAATVDGNNLIQLPQALTYPTPSLPSPLPPTGAFSCAQVHLPATCTTLAGTTTIDPMGATVSLGNLTGNFVLKGGTYNINSIGSGNLTVQASSLGQTAVTIDLAGKTSGGGDLANPFNLNGNAVVNTSMDASNLQILYAGAGTIDLTGGSSASYLVYAPNATVETHGNANIYGSLLVNNITSGGTPQFIYDTRLQKKLVVLGNYMLTSFSWKKY